MPRAFNASATPFSVLMPDALMAKLSVGRSHRLGAAYASDLTMRRFLVHSHQLRWIISHSPRAGLAPIETRYQWGSLLMLDKRIFAAAQTADRNRRRILRNGYTPAGDPIWTEAEKNILRECFPNWRLAQGQLKRRSAKSVQAFSLRRLKLRTKICARWSDADTRQLRKLFRPLPWPDLGHAFPQRTVKAIERKARKMHLLRGRPPLKVIGVEAIDSIRRTCRAHGLAMADLNSYCDSKYFFRTFRSVKDVRRMPLHPLWKAADILGGTVSIVWPVAAPRLQPDVARFSPTGDGFLDVVRTRCRQLKVTMADLDRWARTGTYFYKARWLQHGTVSRPKLCRAIQALGGTLSISWRHCP